MFQPCLERPQIRFGLLKGAARGRRANLPNRFYRPCGEAVSHLPRPSSSALEFRPFGRLKRDKVLMQARYKRRLSEYRLDLRETGELVRSCSRDDTTNRSRHRV